MTKYVVVESNSFGCPTWTVEPLESTRYSFFPSQIWRRFELAKDFCDKLNKPEEPKYRKIVYP